MLPSDAAAFSALAASLSAVGALAAAVSTGVGVRLEHRKWRFDSSRELTLRLTRRFIDLREATRSAVIEAADQEAVNGIVSGGPEMWELLSAPAIQRTWQQHLPETLVDINSLGSKHFREPLRTVAIALSHVAGVERVGVEPVTFTRRCCDLAGELLAAHQRGDQGPRAIDNFKRRLSDIQDASARADERYRRSLEEYERRRNVVQLDD